MVDKTAADRTATGAAQDNASVDASQLLGFASPATASLEGYTGRYIIMSRGGQDGKIKNLLEKQAASRSRRLPTPTYIGRGAALQPFRKKVAL